MARQSRKKKTGVLGTLVVELSALAGILGIAQPAVRNNLWSMLQPPTVNSQLNPSPVEPVAAAPIAQPQLPQLTGTQLTGTQLAGTQQTGALQPFNPFVSQPNASVPGYAPDDYQLTYPPAYTAQANLPRDLGSRAGWRPSGYNPMGAYQ
ncbi:MAG: hypothetical protein SFV81_01425 [Pirellulaceae bacterium]|nr:hypothetical protein [Pirellulaceae bacterium]